MSQINVNPPGPPVTSNDNAVAAGFNLVSVIVVAAVVIVVLLFLWWLVTSSGLLGGQAAPVSPSVPAPAAPTALPKKVGDIVPFVTVLLFA